MEEATYLEMDALIQSLPHVPFISHRRETQECSTCDVSYSHYHVSFEDKENVSFSSRKSCSKCNGTVAESRKGLDEYCCIKCGDLSDVTGVGSQCKSGDGEYTFLCGWPQLTGVQVKSFLGVPATNKRVFMRDCDWWRCENGKILENWCMLDIPHVLLQLGYDLFAEVARTAPD